MGLDISKINAQYTKLVDLAYENDSDNTEHLNILIGEEFTKFRTAAREWANTTNTDEARAAVRETLGLYVTDPTEKPADTTPVETKTEETVAPAVETKTEPTKKEIKEAKEAEKNNRKHVLKFVKGYVEGRSEVTIANLVETLRKDISGTDYQNAITEIETALKDITFSSKDDVEKIKKTLKDKGLSDDLAESIEKIAKREQVGIEKKQLREKYDAIVAAEEQGTIVNYTKRLEKLEAKMNDLNWTGNSYYSDDALDALKNEIKQEIHDKAHAKMIELENSGEIKDKKDAKEVRKLIKKEFPNDTFAHEVIDKMKDFSKVASRGINANITYEELKSVDLDDLKKALDSKKGKEAFNLLNTNWLESVKDAESGKYNLTAISDAIRSAMGADNAMNSYEDFKASEKQQAIENLNKLFNLKQPNVINESHLKELMKLCDLKNAPKDRSAKTAFGNALNEGIAGTAIGSVLAGINIESISKSTAGIIAGAGAKASVKLWPVGLGTAIAEIPLDALINFIFGVDTGERTCFNYEAAENMSIEDYIDHLQRNESEDKAKAIAVLAKLYHAKHGNNWNTEFVKDMKELAGNNTLNCLEFFYGKLELEQKLTATEAVGEQQNANTGCSVIVSDESTPEQPPVDKTKIHNTQFGDTWKGLVEAYYPDLVTKCGGLWREKGAVRALKKALSYNPDGTFNADTYNKLLKGGDLPKVIKLPLEINGVARVDGTVTPENVSGNGRALIDEVGQNAYTAKIPGINRWKAVDGCDETVVYGATQDEAIENLKKQTGKTYTNVIPQQQ